MRKSRNRVKDIIESAPPVSARQALAQNALYQLTDVLLENIGDLRQMMEKQKQKAMEGDTKAFRMATDFLQAMAGLGQKGRGDINQTVIVTNTHVTIHDHRANIVRYIASEGPQEVDSLAKVLKVKPALIAQALDHEYFDEEEDGYHITPKARCEVLEPMS